MDRDSQHDGEYRDGLSLEDRMRILVQVWDEINAGGAYGSANQAVVDEIGREVTDALYEYPTDIDRAESLTFKVFHLIAGNIDSTTT